MRRITALILLSLVIPSGVWADFVGTQRQAVQKVAEPILNNLLEGYNKGDYAQYARNFDDTLREAVTEKKFLQVRQELMKKLGEFKNKEYLGFLNQQRYTVVLWKSKFSATEDDILIRLVLSRRPDKVVVVGLYFQ
uniref:DUF3887 domain-containing protein n=1 Tax=Desulfobacca acetoxidans TaxID=60893 RepID=A0A7V4LDH3_9BACT